VRSSDGRIAKPLATFLDIDGAMTMTVVQPIVLGAQSYALVAVQRVNNAFLEGLAGGTGEAFAFYDPRARRVAHTVAGGALPSRSLAALDEALRVSNPAVDVAIRDAEAGLGRSKLIVGSDNYQVRAHRFRLEADTLDTHYAYLAAVVSRRVSDEAKSTTTNLITMWSVIAVLSLAGLGGWVARRVSDPLVALTGGARRIRDGDFSTKISVSGGNEISDLADSFNQMTDSLRDRSESLTKKVLELATLYEMSRALGSTLEMETLLESVLDSALRIFSVDSGYVTLRDCETGDLAIRAWRGGAETVRDDDALRSSMSEWVIREGRPLIFNPPRDAREARIDEVTGASAALCVPLISAEGTLGAITVGSHDQTFRFTSDDVRLLSTIANHVTIAVGNIELFSSLQDAYLSTVRSLAAAVDAKDPYTRGHSERVATFAVQIAEEMELSHEQRIALEMAAYLHDIGKIGVREEILLKPGSLTDAEMGEMRHHPLIGANILKPVGFPWPITPVVRHHHEAWDGSGYPAGLKGEEIPLLARILTVADAYEAMIADRPYRKGRTIEDAIEELERCSAQQFDERIVAFFVRRLGECTDVVPDTAIATEDVHPDEVQAIFVALADGMLTSFRRLGGPRLASNVEHELNEYFATHMIPFAITQGGMSITSEDRSCTVDHMQVTLKRMDEAMGHTSGASLVDHFYADAAAGLSERMRLLALSLGFLRD
ncbi:MAG: HD domain-containing protein, partial [Coriobacteriia bacterium]|nr:HD domain-containing protein [Coriobacteriia bacterium]